jgi:hypothetical protein
MQQSCSCQVLLMTVLYSVHKNPPPIIHWAKLIHIHTLYLLPWSSCVEYCDFLQSERWDMFNVGTPASGWNVSCRMRAVLFVYVVSFLSPTTYIQLDLAQSIRLLLLPYGIPFSFTVSVQPHLYFPVAIIVWDIENITWPERFWIVKADNLEWIQDEAEYSAVTEP